MIHYNFRHRGPYEYDKFILNVFQFHNEVIMLHGQIFQQGSDDASELLDLKKAFDENFELLVGEDSMSNQIYRHYLMMD
jgi:hypothetical protein